jgi:asparagine synthase (glutamine-hydrolysing)
MCGIVGAISAAPVDVSLLERMRDRLEHRGPDAAASWFGERGHVALGHRRLSVIDPSPDADQPFATADGRFVVVLNGEIYNFRALRTQLERLGSVFRTRCDTEVLVEAYRHFGPACLERLSGMFAFAIWDNADRRLFCARDRAGEKPFHYTLVDGSFVFASELKSLLLWPGFPREIDHTALADFLTFGFVPDPKTIWSDASKLPPGHSLTVEVRPDGGVRVADAVPWWDLSFAPGESDEDWGTAIREAVSAAAGEMAYADVPVGTFLSGGVDSSAVTVALARAGRDVRAFTVGFSEAGFDETPVARLLAREAGVDHLVRRVDAHDAARVFRDRILWHFDEPFGDYSYLPTYYVCDAARAAITVALTGDGGDELFAGYGKYKLLARRTSVERRLSRPVSQAVAAGARAVLPRAGIGRRLHRYEQSPEELLAATLVTGTQPSVLRRHSRGALADALAAYDPFEAVAPHLDKVSPREFGLVNAMRYVDLKLTLGAGILTKVDRAAMAVSLETRPVLLHHNVLELAGRLPPQLLATGTRAKAAFKDALVPWLPAAIIDRPKMGFAAPLGRWLRGDLKELASGLGRGRLADVLTPGFVESIVHQHMSEPAGRPAELHNLIFLEHWLEAWA